jgi:hypothetical protein
MLLIHIIYRSEHVLEASGITVAPPERPRSASRIPGPSVLSTQTETQRQRRLPSKSESSDDEASEDSEDKDSNKDEGMLLF